MGLRVFKSYFKKQNRETGERIHLTNVGSIALHSAGITSIFSDVMNKLMAQNEVIQSEKQTRINVIEKLQAEHRELEQIEVHNNKVIDKIEDIIL